MTYRLNQVEATITLLHKMAEYALRAVVCLAQAPERMHSADRVAAATQIPRRYLHRVFQQMTQRALVRSQSGPNGGYELARPAESIMLIDVINAISPIERIHVCPLGLKTHNELCALHRELDAAYAAIESAFSGVTVAQILNQPDDVTPRCERTR